MTMWRRLSRHYPQQLELIPLVLIVIAFYLAISKYASLPDRIPTHFGPTGSPDEWGSKASVFIFPAIGTGVYVLLTSLNFLLALSKDPKRFVNLPKERLDRLTPARAEELARFLNRSLFALKSLIMGMVVYGVYETVEVALGHAVGLGAPFFVLIAAIIALVIFMTWRSFRLTARTKAPTP